MTLLLARTFPGQDPAVVRQARDAAVAGLPAPVTDAVRLVMSELVTNAHRYSRSGQPGGVFDVQVGLDAESVVLTVADQGNDNGACPQINPAADDTGGRGLCICAVHGVLRITGDASTGWRVTVRLPIPSDLYLDSDEDL